MPSCMSGHATGNGAERPVDVRLAPTGAERRPESSVCCELCGIAMPCGQHGRYARQAAAVLACDGQIDK